MKLLRNIEQYIEMSTLTTVRYIDFSIEYKV